MSKLRGEEAFCGMIFDASVESHSRFVLWSWVFLWSTGHIDRLTIFCIDIIKVVLPSRESGILFCTFQLTWEDIYDTEPINVELLSQNFEIFTFLS